MTVAERNRQEKRKRIMSYFIHATIELIEETGIENLSLRKVADKAGYNVATLYHYFSNLDELELFACVKCLDEYIKATPIHHREGVNFREWYLEQWRCFCNYSFKRPRIYNFVFFSPEGTKNLLDVFERYYEIFPQERLTTTAEYEQFLKGGDFFKRNEIMLQNVVSEKNCSLTSYEIKELNEMSVLIYRGMLSIMRNDDKKPTIEEAVEKTVHYLEKTLCAYHLE